METTVRNVPVRHGETVTYRHFGYKTEVTPIQLAAPFRNWPAGTPLGTVQTRRYFGRFARTECHTGTGKSCVMGRDVDWLVREFLEHQCGERQARHDRVQPGQKYQVRRLFGYLGHEDGLYEEGDELEVISVEPETVVTDVRAQFPRQQEGKPHRPGVTRVTWNRESFNSLIDTAALRELQ